MCRIISLLVGLMSALSIQAQVTPNDFNLTPVGQLGYPQGANDIWGYVDQQGNEYALVGTQTGTSIVSLATPSNPVELLFIPGRNSNWRDLKTWGQHAYVTTEAPDGLLIIDLSPLPNGIPTHRFVQNIPDANGGTVFVQSAHNLYIDEQGYCYLAGSNQNGGGNLILDVHTNPDTPVYVGATLSVYAHDAYARGDTLWTSDINDGHFSVYDISDPSTPQLLAQQTTPRAFTHNAWISDNGRTLFTTDEKSNAWVTAYDVSDLNNIQELDRYRTPTPNTIPHNTHTHNDFQVISYYTDGVIIVDGQRPTNLVEVGRYDTSPNFSATGGFEGNWGAYPYLPSGLLLATDRETGLHVLQPNYPRACWLEGVVTDQTTGQPLFGAQVELLTTTVNEQTLLTGDYKVGLATAGTYQVRYSKYGYSPQTLTVTLNNGILTLQDVQLAPMPTVNFTGQVVTQQTSTGVPFAKVRLFSANYQHETVADATGNFRVAAYIDSNYTVYAGAWGHQAMRLTLDLLDSANTQGITITVAQGYRDEFVLDYDWMVTGTATAGAWEQGVPRPIVRYLGSPNNILPNSGDLPNDLGLECLITGNSPPDRLGENDIDNGFSRAATPVMDLSTYQNPILYFHYFYYSFIADPSTDSMALYLTNGSDTVCVWSTTTTSTGWSNQQRIRIRDHITLTSNMHAYFQINETNATFTEALLDGFEVVDSMDISVTQPIASTTSLYAFPNPFGQKIQVTYDLAAANASQSYPSLQIYNALGQLIEQHPLSQAQGQLYLGEHWLPGWYTIHLGDRRFSVIKR